MRLHVRACASAYVRMCMRDGVRTRVLVRTRAFAHARMRACVRGSACVCACMSARVRKRMRVCVLVTVRGRCFSRFLTHSPTEKCTSLAIDSVENFSKRV